MCQTTPSVVIRSQGLFLVPIRVFLGLLVWAAGEAAARAEAPLDAMIRVRLAGGAFEGKPLSWSSSAVFLLSRDGQVLKFRPTEARDFQKSSPRFYSYPHHEMRPQLYTEFGRDFDVTGTGHYLVVHPRGKRDQWAQRFEDLYRSFTHYFQVRGLKLHGAEFPLVAVVYPNQREYQKAAARRGEKVSPNYLGHYSQWSNRIYLFDMTGGDERRDWSLNAETIIHEATHQTAYNTGVHTRMSGSPRWVVEGLATMFEARGVWNSSRYRTQRDRINRYQLDEFHAQAKRRPEGAFASLLASDRLFNSNPDAAYAEAWAWSFYLCETRPRLYTKYLTKTADRPMLEEYTASERVKDFTDIFGDNIKSLEANFLRYMAQLR